MWLNFVHESFAILATSRKIPPNKNKNHYILGKQLTFYVSCVTQMQLEVPIRGYGWTFFNIPATQNRGSCSFLQ